MSAVTDAIRKEIAAEQETLTAEFGPFTLEDDEQAGEVILFGEDGVRFRCYTAATAADDVRLIIDDYHPVEDGIEVDEQGVPKDPESAEVLALEDEMAKEVDLPDEDL